MLFLRNVLVQGPPLSNPFAVYLLEAQERPENKSCFSSFYMRVHYLLDAMKHPFLRGDGRRQGDIKED
jgi:hypothetical protein